MSLNKQPDLKSAVLSLPAKEKDKLLVRLISKDKMLMKQLHFQLLEDEFDLEERIKTLREQLIGLFDRTEVRNLPNLTNVLALTRLIKQANGMINEHEKVTKDKMSEVEFRILVLKESMHRFPTLFTQDHLTASQKLYKYFSGRIKYILGKYTRLHEDLQFEFREDVEGILDFERTLEVWT